MAFSVKTNLLAATSRTLTSHYGRLSDSVRRLSTGLRVERAADDAAGLAIRELMRADMASLYQGARNINDAISLIQTADGALGVIDEKLIRMKELAEQAATGTYDSTQRLMIDSEFQQMASEIERIARATDFNGIHLLDGSLSGAHNGSGLTATGALKVHFGTANDSAEDYYYVEIGDATLKGLGLLDVVEGANGGNQNAGAGGGQGGGGAGATYGGVPIFDNIFEKNRIYNNVTSGIISYIIPKGTTDFFLYISAGIQNDDINIFTRDGKHIAGTFLQNWMQNTQVSPNDVLKESNGFFSNATYTNNMMNGNGLEVPYNRVIPQNFIYNGMNFTYTGSGTHISPFNVGEELTIDNVTEDLILIIGGEGIFSLQANWTDMPTPGAQPGGNPGIPPAPGGDPDMDDEDKEVMSIKTQELAQKGIVRINDAIVRKDQIRSHLGAVQNRLENTVTNINIQAENLQSAESRISDADIATEMTNFARTQILSQTAVSMLAQANSFPHMLMDLIEG